MISDVGVRASLVTLSPIVLAPYVIEVVVSLVIVIMIPRVVLTSYVTFPHLVTGRNIFGSLGVDCIHLDSFATLGFFPVFQGACLAYKGHVEFHDYFLALETVSCTWF